MSDLSYFVVLNLEEHGDVVYCDIFRFRKKSFCAISINKLAISISVFWYIQRPRALFPTKELYAKTVINCGWPYPQSIIGSLALQRLVILDLLMTVLNEPTPNPSSGQGSGVCCILQILWSVTAVRNIAVGTEISVPTDSYLKILFEILYC